MRAARRTGSGLGPRVAEIAAVVVIGIALAKIAGAWFWPLPVADMPVGMGAPAPARPVALVNPFGAPLASATAPTAADGAPIEAANTDLNLTLFGTWVDGDGGTATIGQADGAQKVYAIGDEICCGARLDKVFATHVLINRSGAIEALRLPNKFERSEELAASPAKNVTASAAQGPGLAGILSLQPTLSPKGVLEFAVLPAGDPDLFAGLGLQENDVIVSVNGRAAPPTADSIPAFFAALRGDKTFKVVVRRGGKTVTIDVSAPLAVGGQEG